MDYKDDFMKDMDKMYKTLKRARRKMKRKHIALFIPVIITLILALDFLLSITNRIDTDFLRGGNYVETIIIVLAFYAFKALTLFVITPMLIYGLTGILFDTTTALVVMLLGLILELAINFIMGRFLGKVYVERFVLRIDDEGRLLDKLSNIHNNRLKIFIMRFIGVPPVGITSVYLAAMELGFRKYMFYSLIGLLPKAISITIAGTSVRNPTSPVFITSVSLLIVFGLGFYFLYKRKQ